MFLLATLLLASLSLADASSFVIESGNSFALDGSPFIAVGPNAFWLGLKQDPSISYPTHAQIEEAFIVAGYMNSTVMRSHTLGITTGDPLSLRPSGMNPQQLNQSAFGSNVFNTAAWETIDYAFTMAEKYNIKLIVPLTDAYAYYNGNYGDYCITRGVNKTSFFTDQLVRADFKDAISQYLNHVNQYSGIAIKNSPALFLIELGNELGNLRPDSTSTAIPTQEWLADIAAYIKTIDMNHLVYGPTDEALGSTTSQDFSVTQLDVFSSHFYYNDQNRMKTGVNAAVAVSKPHVIGEFGSGIGADYYSLVESLKGVKGSLFWSLHPHLNGIAGGSMIPHNDGYSVYYPEDGIVLLRITNHFQRMRGIAVTASIGPLNSTTSSTTSVMVLIFNIILLPEPFINTLDNYNRISTSIIDDHRIAIAYIFFLELHANILHANIKIKLSKGIDNLDIRYVVKVNKSNKEEHLKLHCTIEHPNLKQNFLNVTGTFDKHI